MVTGNSKSFTISEDIFKRRLVNHCRQQEDGCTTSWKTFLTADVSCLRSNWKGVWEPARVTSYSYIVLLFDGPGNQIDDTLEICLWGNVLWANGGTGTVFRLNPMFFRLFP